MVRAAAVTAVMWLAASVMPVGVSAAGTPQSLELPTKEPLYAAEPAGITVVADAPEATPDFTEFFFHFDQMVIEWWQGGGRGEIRGRWQIFAREYARAGKRSDFAVMAVRDFGDKGVVQKVKTALQKSVAVYFITLKETRPSELMVALSEASERGSDVKLRMIPFSSDAELKRVGRAAASALIQLLTVHTKGPVVPTPADKQSR